MKHSEKTKLAKKMAKRGATSIFTSKGWKGRKEVIAKKEALRAKVNQK